MYTSFTGLGWDRFISGKPILSKSDTSLVQEWQGPGNGDAQSKYLTDLMNEIR